MGCCMNVLEEYITSIFRKNHINIETPFVDLLEFLNIINIDDMADAVCFRNLIFMCSIISDYFKYRNDTEEQYLELVQVLQGRSNR